MDAYFTTTADPSVAAVAAANVARADLERFLTARELGEGAGDPVVQQVRDAFDLAEEIMARCLWQALEVAMRTPPTTEAGQQGLLSLMAYEAGQGGLDELMMDGLNSVMRGLRAAA